MSKAADSAKKKRRKTISTVITLLLVVFALVGLGIMLYPSFSDWWNSLHASRSISEYVTAVENIDDSELQAMLAKAREFNTRKRAGLVYEMTDEDYAEYESLLDISGTGIMGYISICLPASR